MTARIVQATSEGLWEASRRLLAGEVVGIPTETVYGLAGLASDDGAVARIFAVKDRPTFDPLIVHVVPASRTLDDLHALGVVDPTDLDELTRVRAHRLMADLWPGPLTLVLPRGPAVSDLVSSGLNTVAVRMPNHSVTQALIRAVGPVAAPSANRFGRISPTRAEDVVRELGERIELVVDGGPCGLGLESTVVSLVGAPTLLRPGGAPKERIEAILGLALAEPVAGAAAAGPGMLSSHYAPRAPLAFLSAFGSPLEIFGGRIPLRVGVLLFSKSSGAAVVVELQEAGVGEVYLQTLSAAGDVEEAARNLFRLLRELDDRADFILVEPCPINEGLGLAIQDRLNRAAGRTGAVGSTPPATPPATP